MTGDRNEDEAPAVYVATGKSRQANIRDNFGLVDMSTHHEAPPPPPPVVTAALRRDEVTFIGRDRELERILAAAGPGRVVSIHTIDGMAGVGKTALATRAAHELKPRFPDGQYFVELHAHTPGQPPTDPSDVLARLLTGLGIDPRYLPDTLTGRRDLWRDRLAGKRVLLVLDDARDHTQIEPLLPTGNECLTLVTSRRRLIALDAALPMALDILDPDPAIELFTSLAHRTPGTDGDRDAVVEIVRLCGYLPLAIVLLAGRLAHHPAWSVAGLADEFAAATDRLAELDVGDRAVRAAFTLSYRDLPIERQLLFQRLGLHPGPDTDVGAAAALADIPLQVARRELESLYTDHLLDETAPGRYRLHDLLRAYARTLTTTDPTSDNDQAVDRLLDYYQAAAISADRWLASRTYPTTLQGEVVREFGNEVQALLWMRTERANLLACLDHAATCQPRRVIDLTGSLAGFLDRDGSWSQAVDLHHRALTAARHVADRLGEANALSNLGIVRRRAGDYDEATDLQQQAQAIYREIGNRLGEANALGNLGCVREETGDYDEATDLQEQAQAIYREIGNRLGEANALGNLGCVREETGDYDEATDLYQQAQAIYREIGNRSGEANTLNNLGIVRWKTGDYDEAIDLYQQAQAIYREIGNRLGEANALGNLGIVRKSTGDYDEAIDLYQQAQAIYCEIGHRLGEANALGNLGCVCEETGDYDEATDLQQQALAIFREIGHRLGEARALGNLGSIRAETGDYDEATDLQQQALTIYRNLNNRLGQAMKLNSLGRVLLATGGPGQALTVFTKALRLACEIGSRIEQARAFDGAAHCRADTGDIPTARSDMRAAVEIYQHLGVPEAANAAAYLAELEARPPVLG
ncbi:ATP-binding protein [Nocardia sp. NPDC004278]